MDCVEYLPEPARSEARRLGAELAEIRIRPGQGVRLIHSGGETRCGDIGRAQFADLLASLMGHSLYAHRRELDNGFFTLPGGIRAGISGRFSGEGPRGIDDIFSVCIRVAREIPGCADEVMDIASEAAGLLVISPPGMGKTTLLRDIARQLSLRGENVCVIDERDEIAGCVEGKASLDVGPRADVYSGCEKARGIMLALRACAPDVIITDEIGGAKDETALMEAVRCGVRLVASAHGASLEKLRPSVERLVSAGAFDAGVLLGPERGHVAANAYLGRKKDG